MKYKLTLKNIADYGKGTFTLSMIADLNERSACKKWISRNPHLFNSFSTPQGAAKIFVLSKEGVDYFQGKDSLPTAKVFYSYLDIAIVNAFMLDVNEFIVYQNRPHISLTLNGKVIRLLSYSWGLPGQINETDIIISTKQLLKRALRGLKAQRKILSKKYYQNLKRQIELGKVPSAFKHYREF